MVMIVLFYFNFVLSIWPILAKLYLIIINSKASEKLAIQKNRSVLIHESTTDEIWKNTIETNDHSRCNCFISIHLQLEKHLHVGHQVDLPRSLGHSDPSNLQRWRGSLHCLPWLNTKVFAQGPFGLCNEWTFVRKS